MIIDIHGHITSPKLFKRFPMPPSLADIDGMIEQKERAGVGLTIVGSPVGEGTMMKVPGLDNYEQPADQLRSFHDWIAETVALHPRRLRAYAYTNPFDERLLDGTAKTVKEAGFVGLIVNTSVRGEYLDSERADAFFAMAAELDVPIFLHPPAEPVGAASLRDYRLLEQVGRFCDVTVGLATLVFGGRLEQYPNLKVIGATGGGALSLLPNRLDMAFAPRHWQKPGAGKEGSGPPPGASGPPASGRPASGPPAAAAGPPAGASGPPVSGPPPGASGPPGGRPPGAGGPGGPGAIQAFENKITQKPSTYLRRLYVDTASYSVPSLMANLETMGADHVMFGTDSPPLSTPLQETIDIINGLPISDADKQGILSGNARRLFKLGDEVAT
jgi:predicted TIM-barrel fold metal-dependent hydrolase